MTRGRWYVIASWVLGGDVNAIKRSTAASVTIEHMPTSSERVKWPGSGSLRRLPLLLIEYVRITISVTSAVAHARKRLRVFNAWDELGISAKATITTPIVNIDASSAFATDDKDRLFVE